MAEKEERHYTSTRTSFTTGKRKYVAVCSCGWEDPYQHSTEKLAQDSGDDHVIAITR